ncbi:MAG: hypothetical protein Q9200_007098, partial [Gallowayella weberi]
MASGLKTIYLYNDSDMKLAISAKPSSKIPSGVKELLRTTPFRTALDVLIQQSFTEANRTYEIDDPTMCLECYEDW